MLLVYRTMNFHTYANNEIDYFSARWYKTRNQGFKNRPNRHIMKIQIQREQLNGGWINVSYNPHFVLGFTEKGFEEKKLSFLLPDRSKEILQLTQIHSAIVLYSDETVAGSRGDGIILTQKDKLAIIKTADCIPLFFWHERKPIGGIIHVGWKGLLAGIDRVLIRKLLKNNINLSGFRFLVGPSICRACYEVGKDLFDRFKHFPAGEMLFFPKTEKKYNMDLTRGLFVSLTRQGIGPEAIQLSGLCNHCLDNFPSYRGDNPTGRIYNFMVML